MILFLICLTRFHEILIHNHKLPVRFILITVVYSEWILLHHKWSDGYGEVTKWYVCYRNCKIILMLMLSHVFHCFQFLVMSCQLKFMWPVLLCVLSFRVLSSQSIAQLIHSSPQALKYSENGLKFLTCTVHKLWHRSLNSGHRFFFCGNILFFWSIFAYSAMTWLRYYS